MCLATQSCPTLCDPKDGSLPGSSVHGDSPVKNTGVGSHALLQGIFLTRDRTHISHIVGRFFTIWTTREACIYNIQSINSAKSRFVEFQFISMDINNSNHIRSNVQIYYSPIQRQFLSYWKWNYNPRVNWNQRNSLLLK